MTYVTFTSSLHKMGVPMWGLAFAGIIVVTVLVMFCAEYMLRRKNKDNEPQYHDDDWL